MFSSLVVNVFGAFAAAAFVAFAGYTLLCLALGFAEMWRAFRRIVR